MENIISIIKKYKIPIVLLSMTIIVVAIALALPKKDTTPVATPSPTPAPTAPPVPEGDWGKLDTIVGKLGSPINKSDDKNKDGTYLYKSSTVNRDNEVVYQGNVPLFYKEIITKDDNKTAKSIKQKYGAAEKRLYGPESDIGFYLYAYPSKGIAYVGSDYDDIVTEVWYFSPTDLNTLMSTWAKEYSLQPLEGIF